MNNKLFDLDAGKISIDTVKMLVLAELKQKICKSSEMLQEQISDAVNECFVSEAVSAISKKFSINRQDVELESYFDLSELREMQSNLVSELEEHAKTQNLTIYNKDFDNSDLCIAVDYFMTALCTSVNVTDGYGDGDHLVAGVAFNPYKDRLVHYLNVYIKFAGDEWCVQTCNGGDSIECGRLVNGNDVGDFDEDMFESRVGLAMVEVASFHASERLESDILDSIMSDKEMAEKATKISNILAGEPRSYARLASSLSVDNLNADDAKYQLHERWGLPKEQVNEVVSLFV